MFMKSRYMQAISIRTDNRPIPQTVQLLLMSQQARRTCDVKHQLSTITFTFTLTWGNRIRKSGRSVRPSLRPYCAFGGVLLQWGRRLHEVNPGRAEIILYFSNYAPVVRHVGVCFHITGAGIARYAILKFCTICNRTRTLMQWIRIKIWVFILRFASSAVRTLIDPQTQRSASKSLEMQHSSEGEYTSCTVTMCTVTTTDSKKCSIQLLTFTIEFWQR